MITIKIGFIVSGIFALAGLIQWLSISGRQKREMHLLQYCFLINEQERERQEALARQREKEEYDQARRVFGLDFLITHGGAFGGCSATCPDGRPRKGSVLLDQVILYGQQTSGKEYNYFIEGQGLAICAGDQPDYLVIKSPEQPFEIREAGMDRDQGVTTDCAKIRKNVLYYVILASHHEISILASANS